MEPFTLIEMVTLVLVVTVFVVRLKPGPASDRFPPGAVNVWFGITDGVSEVKITGPPLAGKSPARPIENLTVCPPTTSQPGS